MSTAEGDDAGGGGGGNRAAMDVAPMELMLMVEGVVVVIIEMTLVAEVLVTMEGMVVEAGMDNSGNGTCRGCVVGWNSV